MVAGIKAKNQRGEFGSSWWAQRWQRAIEGMGWGTRLERGRTYARNGSIVSLDISSGKVTAKVQGRQRSPYRVSIALPPLSDTQWSRAIEAMGGQAIFAAKLLDGEMPHDIEDAFLSARVPLFPRSPNDLITECSCPDHAIPCKHIAAVYYLLGERFDEDPFLLFTLRGRDRQQIIASLRDLRASATAPIEVRPRPVHEGGPALTEQLNRFYEAGAGLAQIQARIARPEVNAAILHRHGPAPSGTDAGLRAVYKAMSEGALRRVFGDEEEAKDV